MSLPQFIAALGIPDSARLDQRVPKKLLLENGAPTAADKRALQDGVDEITWVAALKPTNIGVPIFEDSERQYLEVAVLVVTLRPGARSARLIELIHRAIPYPLVLVTQSVDGSSVSLAHKRWSQAEAGRVVLDELHSTLVDAQSPDAVAAAFLDSLALSHLPFANLFILYDGILARLTAYETAQLTGVFVAPGSAEQAVALRAGLEEHERLRRVLEQLRAQATREKQINRQVELNLEIRRRQTELEAVIASLSACNT